MQKRTNASSLNKYLHFTLLALILIFSTATQASGKFNAQKRYLYVQPGQSIYNIVRVLYPQQKHRWREIIKTIVRKNPHAFIGADASRILAGERLELPDSSTRFKPVASAETVVYKGSGAVGKVVLARGKTFVISSSKTKRDIRKGSEVYVGDRLFTGVSGFVRLRMIDDAKIDLRCNSEMLIEKYRLRKNGNRSVLHLIKGSVNKVTGTIGKMAEDIYEMHTPLATVGVRGTEYAIRVLQSHGCDGSLDVNSRGMFVRVNKGAIDITTAQQTLALVQGKAVHIADATAKAKPVSTRQGVFDAAAEERKRTWFGSAGWLLLLPVTLLLRRFRYAH